ncbi:MULTISPECIES: DUF4349 domain-containing protein [Cyanophyceae]|uniref:DUF4349 domain-containing protein n=1 Tax=Cyanophyceae TaxID=3028117 RepID=UPI00168648EB|nr:MULTISPECIES: DUF4349 domain-containing protein [Cyanophyceae]MBD1916177.1 DUF4349 domain-containing protein [Phormidium sp. FACHB-77]MBD2031554.1 DUF4349 domain-containing protein [Phormidium sp. FACHB-322]MBD2052819.1 DUF4349 domain-containing protein [Leptolyngbya sp. FACHB-60]
MTRSAFLRVHRAQFLAIALGAALIGGCAQASDVEQQETLSAEIGAVAGDAAPAANQASPVAQSAASGMAKTGEIEPAPSDIGQPAPQLVKQASLVLVLADVDAAVDQVQAILQRTQGDMLSLQDHRSPEGTAQQVILTLRVPQAELDSVMNALRPLGTVQQQSLTAEDVSSQLVDLDARLKNLRQSEAALLKIMERSGEISHVLEVARELSTVRESIERMTAQQQNLKRQVAFSQIYLTLQSPVTQVTPLRPVGETLDNTWESATQSVKAFTVSGLKLGLWLLAFSPYWVLIAATGYGGYRLWHHRTTQPDAEAENS